MFHHYPFVKQEDAKECGICCLSMVIDYYHGHYTKPELKELTHTTTKGTTAYHLIEASKQIGFDARGVKISKNLEDVIQEGLILPCIAHVNIEHSGHYIVLYKVNLRKKEVLIADPSDVKVKKISFSMFKEIWTGTLLIMYPIEKLEIHKELPLYHFFLKLILLHKKLLFHTLCFSLFMTIFSIGLSFHLKILVEFLSKQVPFTTILWISLCFGLLYLLKHITSFYRNSLLLYINQKIDITLLFETIQHFIHLPYSIYRNKTTGDILERIGDVLQLRNITTRGITLLFVDGLLCIASFLIIALFQVQIAFLLLVFVMIYVFISFIFTKLIKNQLWKNKKVESQLQTTLTETILGIESIRGLHLEKVQEKKVERKIISYVIQQFHFERIYYLKVFIQNLLKDSWFVILLTFVAYLVNQKQMSIGNILFFQSLILYFLQPIEAFIEFDISIQDATVSLHRLLELFEAKKEEGIYRQLKIKKLDINHLTYQNDYNVCILKDINMTIHRGNKILLLGASGSGKSTLLKLIMQYYEPSSGAIYYNDIDSKEYQAIALERNMSYLSQSETIFTTTLYENIVMERKYQERHLQKVIKCCEIEDIVKNHPTRYHMLLEENGFNISGGEKQRIILARYLLKPTAFLFIDEGLSQVDVSMERRILKNMFHYYRDKTFVVVSHRKENMDLFDRVIELEHGRIVFDVSKPDISPLA